MRVIADDKIPYLGGVLEQIADAEVVYTPGQGFTPDLVRTADALLIRTRTRCDRALLEGSHVQFIATATIGFDHIDTDYCRRAGIAWTNAPGCNSASVAQYVESALYILQEARGRPLSTLTLGVVGVGHVGSRVARIGLDLGMRVLLCDPPREEAGERPAEGVFCPPEALAEACDVITFHVPLSRTGHHATFHLADTAFFQSLKRSPVMINTSRGEVVDTAALLQAMDEGRVSDAIIDVWEGEPHINHTLLYRALLATPHIAGYSADGKANATRAVLDALCSHFGIHASYVIAPPPPPCPFIHASSAADAALQIYDPRRDCAALRRHPERFEQLRGDYPLRRERTAYTIIIR